MIRLNSLAISLVAVLAKTDMVVGGEAEDGFCSAKSGGGCEMVCQGKRNLGMQKNWPTRGN